MNGRASRRVLARRPLGRCLAGVLTLLVFGPRPMTRGAEAAGERNPQRELILLASGSIAGNLEPCG